MIIYGVALLSICTLVGITAGKLLHALLNKDKLVNANVASNQLIKNLARLYLCIPSPTIKRITCRLVKRSVSAFNILNEVFRSPPAATW